jgi:DNA-binding GntR family transcriptional regulator
LNCLRPRLPGRDKQRPYNILVSGGEMNPFSDPSARSESLTDRVYKKLRTEIITGKIPGGSRLVESTLAAEMDVSRTPVREALHKMAMEGLLYSIPRAGYIVEEMSDHDVRDLFTTRTAIEQLAGRWAVTHITPDELHRLETNLKLTDEVIAAGMMDKLSELDIEFHETIYKATRSKSLYRICKNLSDYSLKYRIVLSQPPHLARMTRRHHFRIFEAFLTKDPDQVDEAIRQHMEQAQTHIMELLEQLRRDTFMEGVG